MKTDSAYVAIMDKAGLTRSDVQTSATIVARTNVKQKPYDDQRVRNALQMAVDNADDPQARRRRARHGRREPPRRPDPSRICELPKKSRDIAGAKKLMTDAGQMDFEHDLITSDEE